jgi:hypothetical protein
METPFSRPKICRTMTAMGTAVNATEASTLNSWRLSRVESSRVEWSRVELYVTTDGQSASLSWNKAPIWGLGPDLNYCQTGGGLLIWGALSDKRTVLSFIIAADPRQRSHSRVRVPWDSRPYFPISDSRLPFLSPSTIRKATVEVFDTASTRDIGDWISSTYYIKIQSVPHRKHITSPLQSPTG